MGMELLLVRLTPAQQEAIAADPQLLRLIFPRRRMPRSRVSSRPWISTPTR